jgi:F-box-like
MAETRSIIDRDIVRLEGNFRALEENIQALKFRRNELSPIYRLPAEILCNIFSFSTLSSPESWTNFSQVSQHWRSLALSAPELWTNIPLSYPRWAQEMLIRSKTAKLTIRSDVSYATLKPKTVETIRSCLYEMNRVGAIDITCEFPGSTLEKIFRDLPKSAPQLHTLRIGSSSPLPGNAISIHEDFLYDTERLKRVELFNCKISWDSRLLTGLTRLTLEV